VNTPQIRLFDGRLGCGSCHSLYSQQQKKLVMSNQNGKLCIKCHNK
jgi:predicted CXXCH cytochrome family protein